MVRTVHGGTVWSAALESSGDDSPVRRLVTGRRRSVTGRIYGRKFPGGSCPWESALERDYLVGELFNPGTASIQGQPHRLRAWSDRRVLHHTPDFLVRRTADDGRELVVEVKASYFASKPEAEETLAVSAACHRALGYDWSLLTEAEIQAQPRLGNCEFLLRYRAADTRDGLSHRIAALLAVYPDALDVRACVDGIDGRPGTRFEIYSLACSGEVVLDLNAPLGPGTRVLACRPGNTGGRARRARP